MTGLVLALAPVTAGRVGEQATKTLVLVIVLLVGLRVTGKRELSQFTVYDLAMIIALSNAVQNAIIGEDNSVTGGVIGASTLLLINYAVVRFLYSHEKIDRLVEGEPDVLIENGAIQHALCEKELITMTELEAAAHKQGLTLDEVDRAVMDPGGTIAFFAKKPTHDSTRHEEIMRRLDALSAQLAALKA